MSASSPTSKISARTRKSRNSVTKRLADDQAKMVMLAAGLDPLIPYPGVDKPWPAIHLACGKRVSPRFASLKRGRGGCAYCAGRALTASDARETMRTAGLEPQVPYPGANRPWVSIHRMCGKTVSPRYASIQRGQSGCVYCAGKVVDPLDARETMRAAGLEPQVPYPGAVQPWRCIHLACGKTVSPRYASIQQGHGGCRACVGLAVDPVKAWEIMLVAGLNPLVPYPGAHERWPCIHLACGMKVNPRFTNVKQGDGGCRYCQRGGYNYAKPGVVYLILARHSDSPRGVLKVGITDMSGGRLAKWRKRGWTVVATFEFDDGALPPQVEAAVLCWWRNELGVEPCLSQRQIGGIGGASETASLAELEQLGIGLEDVVAEISSAAWRITNIEDLGIDKGDDEE